MLLMSYLTLWYGFVSIPADVKTKHVMKKISTLLITISISGLALTAAAQTRHKDETAVFHKSIDDDGKTMHIAINGIKTNKTPVKFDKVYNVKGMSKMQKDSIKKHVVDSLGIN